MRANLMYLMDAGVFILHAQRLRMPTDGTLVVKHTAIYVES